MKNRLSIAQEAARLLATHQASTISHARQKAIQRLGIRNRADWPSTAEIDRAFHDYQALFKPHASQQNRHHLLQYAIEAMQFLDPFAPHLTGAILQGNVPQHTTLELHLFTEPPETVALFLDAQRIPFRLHHKHYRLRPDTSTLSQYPCYQLIAENIPFELVIFPLKNQHQLPWQPHENQCLNRASYQQVQALLAAHITKNTNVI